MKSEKEIVKWLQTGYPYVKEESGLPAWIVPEHSFARITDELGDASILEACEPLHFADGLQELLDKAPDPSEVPPEMWQTALKLWPACSQVRPVVDICLDAAGNILRQFQSGRLKVDPVAVCRGAVVLGYAPFVPEGKRLIKELSFTFESDVSEPAELVKKYMEAVSRSDTALIERVDDCIRKHSYWMEWWRRILQYKRDFPYAAKPIGVTPPLSAEITGALAQMMKEEGQDDELGTYHPEHPEGQVCARRRRPEKPTLPDGGHLRPGIDAQTGHGQPRVDNGNRQAGRDSQEGRLPE